MAKRKSKSKVKPKYRTKSKNKSNNFLIVLILLGLLGAGGYYLYAKSPRVKQFFQEKIKLLRESAEKIPAAIEKNKLKVISATKTKTTPPGPPKTVTPVREKNIEKEKPQAKSKEITIPKSEPTVSPQPKSESIAIKKTYGELKISTFSISALNHYMTDDDLQLLAKIVKDYDILAIPAVKNTKNLTRLIAVLKTMGYRYKQETSSFCGPRQEAYSFLYDSAKAFLVSPGKIYSDSDKEFIRAPFYAVFKSGNFDFTLIASQILWGKNEEETRHQLFSLAKVYMEIQDKNSREQDIILLGDFSFTPADFGWEDLKSMETMSALVDLPQTSSIDDKNLFDNIWLQKIHVQEYTGTAGINKFDETIFADNDNKAETTISRRRPVWAIFATTKKDDD
jgi:hypothetical protein